MHFIEKSISVHRKYRNSTWYAHHSQLSVHAHDPLVILSVTAPITNLHSPLSFGTELAVAGRRSRGIGAYLHVCAHQRDRGGRTNFRWVSERLVIIWLATFFGGRRQVLLYFLYQKLFSSQGGGLASGGHRYQCENTLWSMSRGPTPKHSPCPRLYVTVDPVTISPD